MNREQWIEDTRTKLALWEDELSELESRAEALDEKVRAETREAAHSARERLERARAQLKKAEDVGEEAWDRMKDRIQVTWKEQKKGLEDALEKMKVGRAEEAPERGTREGVRGMDIGPPRPSRR